jgi:hypothetical protein
MQTETIPDTDIAEVVQSESPEADPFELLGPPLDHALPVDSRDLTRRSKPVIALQQLCNWIHREARPTAEEELAELRSEVPRRWLGELRAIVQEETNGQTGQL